MTLRFALILALCTCFAFSASTNNLYEANDEKYNFDLTRVTVADWEGSIRDVVQTETEFERLDLILKDKPVQCYIPVATKEADKTNEDTDVKHNTTFYLDKMTNCVYSWEGWWSYEFCWGKHVMQFHQEEDKARGDTFYLGFGNTSTEVVETKKYVSVTYRNGTLCELSNTERQIELRFSCASDGFVSIRELREPETCHYVMDILTPYICKHPKYRLKKVVTKNIKCYEIIPNPEVAVSEREQPRFKDEPVVTAHFEPVGTAHVSGGEGSNTHFTAGDFLQVRQSDNPNGKWKSLIQFDITDMLYLRIKSATLVLLPHKVNEKFNKDPNALLSVKVIPSSWSESDVTWLSRPKKGVQVAIYRPAQEQPMRLDVTSSLLSEIIRTEEDAETKALFSISIATAPTTVHQGLVKFCSRDSHYRHCVPKLEVEYWDDDYVNPVDEEGEETSPDDVVTSTDETSLDDAVTSTDETSPDDVVAATDETSPDDVVTSTDETSPDDAVTSTDEEV